MKCFRNVKTVYLDFPLSFSLVENIGQNITFAIKSFWLSWNNVLRIHAKFYQETVVINKEKNHSNNIYSSKILPVVNDEI